MQPYTADNDLLLTETSAPRKLTLPIPANSQSINVLDTSCNGTGSYNMTLNFSDGTSDQIATGQGIGNRDGVTGASGTNKVATVCLGQMQRSDGTVNYATGTGAMWEQDFTLSAADQAKTLTWHHVPGKQRCFGRTHT